MFCYVEESGHSGQNLFDPDRPVLYYNVCGGMKDVRP